MSCGIPAAAGRSSTRRSEPSMAMSTITHPSAYDVEVQRVAATRSPSDDRSGRSEEHTSELQSLMRISYAVFCLKKKNHPNTIQHHILESLTNIHKQST